MSNQAKSLINKVQRRLLDSNKYEDYFFAFIIAITPLFLSIILGFWKQEGVDFESYQKATNFHSLIISLPVSLFLLRAIGNYLFGVKILPSQRGKVPLISLFNNDSVQAKIHQKLKQNVLNDKIFYVTLTIDIIFHIFDTLEIIKQYIFFFLGKEITVSKYYWANLFLIEESIDPIQNLLFTIIAYLPQFFIFMTGLMLMYLFASYNLLFIRLIYCRSKHQENFQDRIVLNFDDPNYRFGLEALSNSFNVQLVVLFLAGIGLLFSRIHQTEISSLRTVLSDPQLQSKLLPSIGQYIIVILWLTTFFIVLLPALIKFLPFSSRYVASKTWSIQAYLKEFIPHDHASNHYLSKTESLNVLASKFAWNSFWPSGDDIARFLFYFVFFVCLYILLPTRDFVEIVVLIIIGILLGETFLNIFRWALGHIDDRLVTRKIKPGDTIIMGDNFQNIGAGATIVNRSKVEKSFNKVREEFDEETAKSLNIVEQEINKSGNKDAAELFDTFNEELQKPEPKKSVLRTCWKGIELALPSITTLTKIVLDISKLFI
ncbi:hypothetical protein FJR38_25795 [Anabaena sp. UHCC 0253]|uniref:hypothetical protein n=1 Tax=Anabaena sp. UHCC 0253 TaxID=2590019 RepID=UPI00144665FD|nr:hypothetical protein [Anabaena sp. UHCC 0253]MTJ55832.1 hypothetical protein [Anabaena sp. UHCC 0253]